MKKIVILGGRSGTSVMYRMLLKSRLKGLGGLEPSGLTDHILARRPLKDYFKECGDWDIIKCPELAFVLPEFRDLFPEDKFKFIWMTRSVAERVGSHVEMGWDLDLHERIYDGTYGSFWADLMGDYAGESEMLTPKQLDATWFSYMDDCIFRFFRHYILVDWMELGYNTFNNKFFESMKRVATFLNLDYSQNINAWSDVKSRSQQAGSDAWIKF